MESNPQNHSEEHTEFTHKSAFSIYRPVTMLLYSNRDLTVIFVVKSLLLQNNPIFTTVFAVKS